MLLTQRRASAVQVQASNRPSNYYSNARPDIAALVPPEARRVLDVGCGAGELGQLLRQRGHWVGGVELVPAVAAQAALHLDEVVCADIDSDALPWPPGSFDAVLCADVLEHLADPWGAVGRLVQLLAPGGWLIASVPNVQNYRVIRGLLRGRWTYRPRGILDHGHLRFFTREGIRDLYAQASLEVTECRAVFHRTLLRRLLCVLSRGWCEPFLARGYHVVGRKTHRPGHAAIAAADRPCHPAG
jgi:2-polyprenyl-3-methyl-5-hydroxy-6-metoxy-1,4-benzoquinol methylase